MICKQRALNGTRSCFGCTECQESGCGFTGNFDPAAAINHDWVSSHFGFENNRHVVL